VKSLNQARILAINLVLLLIFCIGCMTSFKQIDETIDLSGVWKFQLDPDNIGITEKWFNKEFSDSVLLPGTTDINRKGIFLDERAVDRLSRVWFWEGAAWYQKEVIIPENWKDKKIRLLLERTKDTHVWFDEIHCGYENTLSGFQYFNIPNRIKTGKHLITVLVNNAKLPPVGNSFAISEKTQTNWNGIIGKIELQMSPPIWINEVQIYPDIKNNSVLISAEIENNTDNDAESVLEIMASSWNTDKRVKFKTKTENISLQGKNETVEILYSFNKKAPLWDEFDPVLIRMNLVLTSHDGENSFQSSKLVDFGMREFKREGKHLFINGHRVFLRGRIDCANYPLTGHAPDKKSEWLKLFRVSKNYGINHWRFHSWCPPSQAFAAADEAGIFLQPELPNQSYDMDKRSLNEDEVLEILNYKNLKLDTGIINMPLKEYLRREGELILSHFGNHPSFVMFTLGNELGRNDAMFQLIDHFQAIDPRRLYSQGSNNMTLNPSIPEGDDFWVTARTSPMYGIRGSFAKHLCPQVLPHIEYSPPSTLHTYDKAIEDAYVPVISHEIGQFQVSPDFSEIPRYTGVTRARNYEIFRERLKRANMLNQFQDFVAASGKLAVLCYKEDIEAALRTPDFSGFQLLDIADFPGQGTAPVGILNVFLESKGLITPEEWKYFCSEVAPLLKMEKYTWTNNEHFTGILDVAHYGKENLKAAVLRWEIKNINQEILFEGNTSGQDIVRGTVSTIGNISFPLDSFKTAEQLKILITIEGTQYKNEYDIWVYPHTIDINVPDDILVTELLDSRTIEHLENGGKALIIPDHSKLTHSIQGAFTTDFWCYPMFLRGAKRRGTEPAPGSLGFICDPDSPLFADFPTEFHSNWQWWHLAKNCKPVILDETPADYKPMVQTIDNFARNHKLGMIFETKYGEGSALICAIDLLNLQDKPEARQLYLSLINYMNSNSFDPEKEINKEILNKILP
jgi:hypothetical protein